MEFINNFMRSLYQVLSSRKVGAPFWDHSSTYWIGSLSSLRVLVPVRCPLAIANAS